VANAQNIEFEDQNFKSALIYLGVDTNNDGEISQQEAKTATSLNVKFWNITSLQGIEYFTNLTVFDCSNNHLTELNLSNNTNLLWLFCSDNELTSLNVLNNSHIMDISCADNKLTSLDVSDNTNLQYLDCENNLLTTLDISNNTNLETLQCINNQLTELDVSNNTNLEYLFCYINQIPTLNLSNHTKLRILNCSSNQLTTLNLLNTPKLTHLLCDGNQLTSLNISESNDLQHLECSYNQLTTLNVSNNHNLQWFDCYDNHLVSLYMKNGTNEQYQFLNNPNLIFICCDASELASVQNHVTQFNVGNNPIISTDCTILSTQETPKNKILIYPNPVKNILNIQGFGFNVQDSRIYDISGKLVKTFSGNSVDVSGFQKGIYILNIDNQSVKFIKN
jgi:Leucine-rich repeat (LRR) protein